MRTRADSTRSTSFLMPSASRIIMVLRSAMEIALRSPLTSLVAAMSGMRSSITWLNILLMTPTLSSDTPPMSAISSPSTPKPNVKRLEIFMSLMFTKRIL